MIIQQDMLILFPNFLTGSNEMDTEIAELKSLLLLVTTSYLPFIYKSKHNLRQMYVAHQAQRTDLFPRLEAQHTPTYTIKNEMSPTFTKHL